MMQSTPRVLWSTRSTLCMTSLTLEYGLPMWVTAWKDEGPVSFRSSRVPRLPSSL